MTRYDFDIIFLESFRHETPLSFYEQKRKSYECYPREFAEGLWRSFISFSLFALDCEKYKKLNIEMSLQDFRKIMNIIFEMKKNENKIEYSNINILKLKKLIKFTPAYIIQKKNDSDGNTYYYFPEKKCNDYEYYQECAKNMAKPDDFYKDDYNSIYLEVLYNIYKRRKKINPILLNNLIIELKEKSSEILKNLSSEFNMISTEFLKDKWHFLKSYFESIGIKDLENLFDKDHGGESIEITENGDNNDEIYGFNCSLDEIQKKTLFNYLIEQKIIDKCTSEVYFLSLFNEEQLPKDWEKIKWLLLNPKGKPHQQALRDLFEVLLGKENIPSPKRINDFFTDRSGNPIKFSKPHGNSNYLKDFEDVLK